MKIGDKVPEILGIDANGKEIRISDFCGKKVILYFYPKDNTPGCTAEACSLRDSYDKLKSAGYEIIGVSKDRTKSHIRFIEKYNLPFTLIADTEVRLNEAFGVWQEKNMYGRKYKGTIRTTFIIDENGVISDIIEKVDTQNHAEQILCKV